MEKIIIGIIVFGSIALLVKRINSLTKQKDRCSGTCPGRTHCSEDNFYSELEVGI